MIIAAIIAVLIGGGVYMVLQRGMMRLIVGITLLSHGVNLLILAAGIGAWRAEPLLDRSTPELAADPLPQHEGVLGADGHDQGQAGHQPGKERRSHPDKVHPWRDVPDIRTAPESINGMLSPETISPGGTTPPARPCVEGHP